MSLIFIRFLACFKCRLEFSEEKLVYSSNGRGLICAGCKKKEVDRNRLWGYPKP